MWRPPQSWEKSALKLAVILVLSNLILTSYFLVEVGACFAMQISTPVHLPVPSTATRSKVHRQTVVYIRADGSLEFNQQLIKEEELLAWLKRAASARVFLKVDKDVRYTKTKQILQTIGKSGVQNVTLAIVDKSE